MRIFAISGSTRRDSGTQQFLIDIQRQISKYEIEVYPSLYNLPLFDSDISSDFPKAVIDFRKRFKSSDIVLIITPEYIHNIPAALKSALEWVTASGELENKKVIAFTYTPEKPRGENALVSLKNSLSALKANVIVADQLFKTDFEYNDGHLESNQLDFLVDIIELNS